MAGLETHQMIVTPLTQIAVLDATILHVGQWGAVTKCRLRGFRVIQMNPS